ncbi:hypothetical protein H6G32_21940 [Cylindrospermum sp. FACHB-282]|nr:hypothetical protein [Cylindrospermum sp. FACHB-282]
MKKDIDTFIYPPSLYCNNPTPENIAFNTQLQKLAAEIAYISGLEASGLISPDEAYKEVKALWKQFQQFKKGIDGKPVERLKCA